MSKILAQLARKKLSEEKLEKALLKACPAEDISEEQIDAILSHAAQKALKDIDQRHYHGPIEYKAKKIIDLGLAIFGKGNIVKAIFGPK
jgi:transcriptional regulator NrdR family protein